MELKQVIKNSAIFILLAVAMCFRAFWMYSDEGYISKSMIVGITICVAICTASILILTVRNQRVKKKLGLKSDKELYAWKRSCRVRYDDYLYASEDFTLFFMSNKVYRTNDIMNMRDYTKARRKTTGWLYCIEFTIADGKHDKVSMKDRGGRDRLHADMEQLLAEVKQRYRGR